MAIEVKTFVLGKDKYPDWFKKMVEENRATIIPDPQGGLAEVIIKNDQKYTTAKSGETLILMQNRILVVPPDAAEKYMK